MAFIFGLQDFLMDVRDGLKDEPPESGIFTLPERYTIPMLIISMLAAGLLPPSNSDSQFVSLAESKPHAPNARTHGDLLGPGEQPDLNILSFMANPDTRSEIGSLAFGHMGPDSACPSDSSDGSDLSLQSTRRIKPGLSPMVTYLSSFITSESHNQEGDGSSDPINVPGAQVTQS